MSRLPDAVGIGFRRCASSWLHNCLNEHPEVGKTAGGVHYFSEHLAEGDSWYLAQLAPFADRRLVVDFSVSYGYPEHIDTVVSRLPALLPRAKFFAIMRHPADRAFSDYHRSLFREELPPETTFEQALEKEPLFLTRGCYGQIMQKLATAVEPERIGYFFYDDVRTQPDRFWRELCHFLAISPDFTPSLLRTRIGHLGAPKHATLHGLIRGINRLLTSAADRVRLGRTWQSLKKSRWWRMMIGLSVKQKESIAPATRQRLLAYYADDVRLLARLSGRNLDGWLV
jgi:hypothetical protein